MIRAEVVVPLFPVFLNLAGRRALVVGGGRIGRTRAQALAEAGAALLVVDPLPSPELRELAARERSLRIEARGFEASDLDGCLLAFACSGRSEVDDAVLREASLRGVLACRSGSEGDEASCFTSGALLRRGELCLAVSSGSSSPGLAALARDRAAGVIGDEFGEAASLLSALRAQLRARGLDAAARQAVMRRVLSAGVVELLRDGDRELAMALVDGAAAMDPHEDAPCIR